MTPQQAGAPKTAIVVVNYGSSALLSANLAAGDAPGAATETVIVDNFTSTAEAERLAHLAAENGWRVVWNERNVGFGTAVNAGVEHARSLGCSAFIVLNPDAIITAAVAAELFASVVSNRNVLVAPRIVRTDGRPWFEGATLDTTTGFTSTAPGSDSASIDGWITGACVAVHDDLWTRSGGFDDDYFLYWEDVDLSWRCRTAGGFLRVRADLEVVHDVGGTQAGTGKTPAYVYYNCRNRLLFAAKNLPAETRRAWSARNVSYAYRIITRGAGRRVLYRRPRLIAAAISGTWAGARGRTGAQR
ncbi:MULTISPECIES: glycosyltransferase family 2 protein [unclassified Leifsonia]|uniref:glycosyltransferase family 2 protein n=1 Tax=unclassified Leifsonia TaxID=2663824 RepID=UPI0006F591A9|nr:MULTISPECIES: glycosyltransferase family 2 protein [unclassified Leifsonia]KQX08042.1 hypothetical protein ASC59_10165 [Leifsonia sp. Root1293]KRA12323.1 hypothetical protein ASD61_10165 [Leifsonia sp. Root60]